VKRHSTQTVAGDVTRELCERFPHASTMSLARKLIESPETRLLFPSVEHARDKVRWWRGLRPGRAGKRAPAPIPAVIPEPDAPDFKIVTLPTGLKWLFISDLHIPYHDRRAVELAVQHGKRNGCNGVLIVGDLLDCYQLSTHEKDPRKSHTKVELEKAKQLLEYLAEQIRPEEMLVKLGNHEDRLHRYLCQRASELLDLQQFSWADFLELERFGAQLVESNWLIENKALTILHGHEFGKGGIAAPVNPSRGAFLRTNECVIMGHGHRTSQHVETTLRGRVISCWSMGCLCDLHPRYAPVNKWNLGFGILDARNDEWEFRTPRIIDYRVCE
jgi:predicted phosphodiesterase